MVSKNNLKYYEQRHALYQKPHFGLRKLSIGVASVLLSTTFFLGKAHADEVTGTENNDENSLIMNNDAKGTGTVTQTPEVTTNSESVNQLVQSQSVLTQNYVVRSSYSVPQSVVNNNVVSDYSVNNVISNTSNSSMVNQVDPGKVVNSSQQSDLVLSQIQSANSYNSDLNNVGVNQSDVGVNAGNVHQYLMNLAVNTDQLDTDAIVNQVKAYGVNPVTNKIVSIKSVGALGDGQTDDTASIQSALDQVKNAGGGIVFVPAGNYMVKVTTAKNEEEATIPWQTNDGLNVGSNTTLLFDNGAKFTAIPNPAWNYVMLNINRANNVNILGSELVGDRDKHDIRYTKSWRGTPNYDGETGWGIITVGAHHVNILHNYIHGFWGDGIDLYGDKTSGNNTDINIKYNTIDDNRRQGISIENVDGAVVDHNLIENTHGTAPQAGIDIEPSDFVDLSMRVANNVQVTNNYFKNNNSSGLMTYVLNGSASGFEGGPSNVNNLVVKNNTFDNNNTNSQNFNDKQGWNWQQNMNGQLTILGTKDAVIENNKLINPNPKGLTLKETNGNFGQIIDPNTYSTAGMYVGYNDNVSVHNNYLQGQDIFVTGYQSPFYRYHDATGSVTKNYANRVILNGTMPDSVKLSTAPTGSNYQDTLADQSLINTLGISLVQVGQSAGNIILPSRSSQNLSAEDQQIINQVKAYQVTPVTNKIINVKDRGIVGDGKTDQLNAIQKVLDEVKNAGGGIVYLPAGKYMIDALSIDSAYQHPQQVPLTPVEYQGLQVGSNTTLLLDKNASLNVIPNNYWNYLLVDVHKANNVNILGGNFVGDRKTHDMSNPNMDWNNGKGFHSPYYGEWGTGLSIDSSSNVVVAGINFSDFWGDGISLFPDGSDANSGSVSQAKNVRITWCTFDHNRRQGISVGHANGVEIDHNVIQNTNGTGPAAGIDLEPGGKSSESILDVKIHDNVLKNNNNAGVTAYAAPGSSISNLHIYNNTFIDNSAWMPGQLVTNVVNNIEIDHNKFISHSAGVFNSMWLMTTGNADIHDNYGQNSSINIDKSSSTGKVHDNYMSWVHSDAPGYTLTNNQLPSTLTDNQIKNYGVHLAYMPDVNDDEALATNEKVTFMGWNTRGKSLNVTENPNDTVLDYNEPISWTGNISFDIDAKYLVHQGDTDNTIRYSKPLFSLVHTPDYTPVLGDSPLLLGNQGVPVVINGVTVAQMYDNYMVSTGKFVGTGIQHVTVNGIHFGDGVWTSNPSALKVQLTTADGKKYGYSWKAKDGSKSTAATPVSTDQINPTPDAYPFVSLPVIQDTIKIVDVDDNNKVLSSQTVASLPSNYDSLVPVNYSLAGYNLKDTTLTIQVRHQTKAVTENNPVVRHVTIVSPNGQTNSFDQKVVFGRAGVQDLVTGKTNWSVWDPASGVLDAVDVPLFPGYARSGQINVVTVTPDSQDSSVTVTYKKIIQSDSTSSSASQSGSASSSSTTVPSAKYSVDVIDLDENNKTVSSNQIDKIPDDYRQLVPANYTLASYHLSGQTLTLQVHHSIQPQIDNHTVTRTVDMVWPTGHHEYNTQQVTFSRTGYKDMVTGKTKWTDWQSDNDTFEAVKPKEFPGYTINGSAGAVTVKPDAKDSTVVITYSKISNSSQASSSSVTPPVVKYTIDILDVDESNKTLSSNQVNQLPATYDNLIPTNYSLVGYSINGQTLTIKVRHNVKAVKENTTVTRNIIIIDPTGHRQEAPQSVTFGRAGIQDLVTGKTTWKAWDPSSEIFDAISTPDFPGYTKHGSIDKMMVTPDSKDSTVTVTYTKNETSQSSSASSQTSSASSTVSSATSSTSSSMASSSSSQTSSGSVVSPTIKFVVDVIDVDENNKTLTSNEVSHLPSSYNSLIPINYSLAGYNIKGQTLTIKVRHNVKAVTENKTVIRNIVIIDPTGHRQEGPQSVTFGRAGVKDLVTGQTNWKPWDPASAVFDAISTPDFPGYTKHGSVYKITVTPDSQDSTVTITYTRNDSGSHSGSQTSSASSSVSSQTSSVSSTASSVTSSTSSSAASSGSSQTSSGSVVSPTVKFLVDVIDVDENDKTLSSNEVDHLPAIYDSLIPTNYSLAGYNIKGQTLTIKVRHNVKSVTENKTVTRNIVIVDPTGHRQTGQQQVTFGRAGIKDLVTGQTNWKAWDPANAFFDEISTPDFPGYIKHGSIDKVAVTPNSQDSTITITYIKNDSGSHSGSQTSSAGSSTASSTQSSGSTASSASSNASSSTSSTSSSAGSSSSSQTSSGSVVSPTVKFVVDVLDVDENNKTLSSNEVDHLPSSYDSLIPKNYSLAGYSIKDQMLTIKVRHNVKTVTENKTVTRHIVMIDPFGRRQTGDQSVTFGRAGVQDLVTGNTIWKAWDPDSHQFNAVNMPDFVGYKPSINVNAITVTPGSKDITVTVVYTKTSSDSNVPGSSTASSVNSSVTSSATSSIASSTTSSTASSTMSSVQNSSAAISVSSATTSNIDSNTSSVQSSVASSTASSVDSSVVSSTQSSAISSANSRVLSSAIISSANGENSSQASSSVINSDVNNAGVNSTTSQNSQVDNISNSVASSVVIGSNSLATVNSHTEQQSEINQSLNSIMNSVSSFNDAGNQSTQANSNVQAVQNNAGQVGSTLQKVQPDVTTNANGGLTMTVPLGAVVSGRTINTTGIVNNQAEAGQNGQSTGSLGLPQTGKSDQDRAMVELGLADGMFVLGLAGTNKKLRKKRQ